MKHQIENQSIYLNMFYDRILITTRLQIYHLLEESVSGVPMSC